MKYLLALLLIGPIFSFAETKSKTETVAPANARVFFVNLKDGQTVPTKFKVEMGLEGMKLRNAAEDVNDKTSGHHHILINQKPIPEGQPIPADDNHIHFGKSQKEAEVTLKPGKYTLTLQLADGAHRSYGEKLSATINISVK